MCVRRDDKGRLLPGQRSLNPRGRAETARLVRLLRLAETSGCEITIRLPARPANDATPEAA